MKRLVLLTYGFPPHSSGGTPVVINLSKYMPQAGWEVLPLVPSNPRGFSLDHTLEEQLPRDIFVTRIRHPEPFRSGRGRGRVGGSERRIRRDGLLRRLIDSFVLVPDRLVTWGRKVVPAGTELVSGTNASVIVSFGPHHSLHLHAMKIARRTGVPFVPFFGDLWLADSYVSWPSRLNRCIESRMERSVIRRASGIAVTTEGAAGYFREAYSGICPPLQVVDNGYDPDRIGEPSPPKTRGDHLLVTFTGNFFGNQTPEPLVRGLEILRERRPDAPLRMRFTGVIEDPEIPVPGVEFTGPRQYSEIPALQKESDILLTYLVPLPGSEMKISSKFAEYLRSGRTIMAVAPEGDMTGYVRRFRAGYVCEPTPQAIADTLEQILDHWGKGCLIRTEAHDEIADVFDARNVCSRFARFLDGIAT